MVGSGGRTGAPSFGPLPGGQVDQFSAAAGARFRPGPRGWSPSPARSKRPARRSWMQGGSADAGTRERNFASISLDIAGVPSMAGSETVFALMPDGNGIVEFRRVGGSRRVFYPRRTAQPADAETVEKLAR